MKCPHCDVNLLMSERQGVEIDYCPECRGVWLDRGELDKIVERSHADVAAGRSTVAAPPSPSAPARDDREWDRVPPDGRRDEPRGHEEAAYKKKTRKSFLEDIFDF